MSPRQRINTQSRANTCGGVPVFVAGDPEEQKKTLCPWGFYTGVGKWGICTREEDEITNQGVSDNTKQ